MGTRDEYDARVTRAVGLGAILMEHATPHAALSVGASGRHALVVISIAAVVEATTATAPGRQATGAHPGRARVDAKRATDQKIEPRVTAGILREMCFVVGISYSRNSYMVMDVKINLNPVTDRHYSQHGQTPGQPVVKKTTGNEQAHVRLC